MQNSFQSFISCRALKSNSNNFVSILTSSIGVFTLVELRKTAWFPGVLLIQFR